MECVLSCLSSYDNLLSGLFLVQTQAYMDDFDIEVSIEIAMLKDIVNQVDGLE